MDMVATERRRADNALLRTKIDHVQGQALSWAREGRVVDLPSTALATTLRDAFAQQRQAMTQIQQDIGVVSREMPVPAVLISEEELNALLK